jgi:hypothetical protein
MRLEPPPIPLVLGAANVEILTRESFGSRQCEDLGRISAADGITGSKRTIRYIGTEERARDLLKIEALRVGADTAVISQMSESLRSDNDTGFKVELFATAYRCGAASRP